MEISTYAAWIKERTANQARLAITHPLYVQSHIDRDSEADQERQELLRTFPYSVVAEGDYAEHLYARRWCWQNIGHENGICTDWRSDFPACPLVLETETTERLTWKDKDGAERSRDKKRYKNPGDHEHEGQWRFLWFGKTGYDYGYGEYLFTHETDRARFLAAFATFTWNDAWEL